MGRNVGVICQETTLMGGTKLEPGGTTPGGSPHSGLLSPAEDILVTSWMLIDMESAGVRDEVAFSDSVLWTFFVTISKTCYRKASDLVISGFFF